MANELYEKVRELTDKTLKYKPISEKEAIGKVVEKFYILYFGWKSIGRVITFTDKTALYYDSIDASYPEIYIHITEAYGNDSNVKSFLTDFGQALHDKDLLNDLEELLQAEKQLRIAYNEENKQREINRLKEKLKQLEG